MYSFGILYNLKKYQLKFEYFKIVRFEIVKIET